MLAASGPMAIAGADDAARVREQIESVLSAMAAAAIAGDQQAYLVRIAEHDEVFLTEQRAWAADLDAHPPELLEFTLSEAPNVKGDVAVANLRIRWAMEGVRPRQVAFPARFVLAGDEWRYAGEDWKVVDGDRVKVMFLGDSEQAARAAATSLPEIRERVTADFGLGEDEHFAAHVQQIKLYTSMAHLQQSIYLSYSTPLSGWNEPGESIKLLGGPDMGRRSMRNVLAHEFGHVASFQLGPRATDMPWWILEGVAELVAEPWAGNGERTDRTVRQWARTGRLREWEELADFRGEAMNHVGHVYRQGHQMLRFITSRYGPESRNRWMALMALGGTLDEATREVMGIEFRELDALWRAHLGAETGGEQRQEEEQGAALEPAASPQ